MTIKNDNKVPRSERGYVHKICTSRSNVIQSNLNRYFNSNAPLFKGDYHG